MSTRLLLEGPTIEGLLAQVRAEHGDGARIVQADKVRTGGFAGFFAKERFELAVEVDEDDPLPDTLEQTDVRDALVRRATAALSILELVDDADEADGEHSGLAAIGFAQSEVVEVVPATPAELPAPVPPKVAALYTPAAAASPAPLRPAVEADDDSPLVSTTSPSFARVLAALTRDMEEVPERTFAPAPFATPAAVEPAATAVVEEEEDAESAALRARAAFEAVVAASEPVRAPVAEVVSTPTAEVAEVAAPEHSPAAKALLAVGVPARLLADAPADADLRTLAVFAADQLPAASACATGAGEIVVIVGDGRTAYAAARTLAATFGLDAETVLLAAPSTLSLKVAKTRHIGSWRDAVRRLPALRRTGVPVLVAVDASVGRSGAEWALEVIDSLQASTIWLLADASRKAADTRATARALGALDAVVVHNAAVTSTPGDVLSLSLPVALVDGTTATPAGWAELLVTAAQGVLDDTMENTEE